MIINATGILIIVASVILIAILISLWNRRGGTGWALPIAATLFVEGLLVAFVVYHKSIPVWEYVAFGISMAFAIVLLFVSWPKQIEVIGGVILPIVTASIVVFTAHVNETRLVEILKSGGKLLRAIPIPLWLTITVVVLLMLSIILSLLKGVTWIVKLSSWIAFVFVLFISVSALIALLALNQTPKVTTQTGTSSTTTVKVTTQSTPTPIPTPTPSPSPEDPIIKDLVKKENGSWEKDKDYTFNPDLSKDRSTTGDGAVKDDGIKTPSEMVKWLASRTKNANAMIDYLIKSTGASRAAILDQNNWKTVQALVDFTYPGNTSLSSGGNIVDAGGRSGKAGDVFLAFINPMNKKIVYVRGACANPQAFTPRKPPTPTPTTKPTITTTTTTLKPKSSDPSDYKRPGDGTERDSGTGTKPIVPTVTATAESTPPTVVSTTAPGETILAPSATPVPTRPPSATPTPTPRPVMPTTEPTSSGTIVNPFG